MTRICFVGNEIYPTTSGGAGFLVYRLAQDLLAEGHEVILLLNVSKAAMEQFERIDSQRLGGGARLRAYHVDALCKGQGLKESDFLSRYAWESYRYDLACRQVYAIEKPELIEFVDYCGPAYYALNAKLAGLSYQQARIVIRIHGPLELIDRSTPYKALDFDRYTAYALERGSFRLAEAVLFPTEGFLEVYYGQDAQEWYGRATCCRPPASSFPPRQVEAHGANIVLFYGRLFSVKGAERFVNAGVALLARRPDLNLQFYLVGYDSNEPPEGKARTYREYLQASIPAGLGERFMFTGQMSHAQVSSLLPRILMGVVPSYFESFGYSAHELRQAGTPLILADIPAFRAEFADGVEALFFDSTGSLVVQMERLAEDEALRKALSAQKPRQTGDPLEFYRQGGWESWMSPQDGPPPDPLPTVHTLQDGDGVNQRVMVIRAGAWEDCKETKSKEALLLLGDRDEVENSFLEMGLAILERHPQVGFVCGYKRMRSSKKEWIQTHPAAAMVELLPFEAEGKPQRYLLRTQPGIPLSEVFDERLGALGEIELIWRMEDDGLCGLQIPEVVIHQEVEAPIRFGGSSLAYLLLERLSSAQARRLGVYFGMLSAGYPGGGLPLQTAWAEKNGFEVEREPGVVGILAHPGWRRRLYLRLSRGGRFSQALLSGLMRIWRAVNGFGSGLSGL